jgi:phenylpropionate dioxygenase-like ring-hydroxylating dioxygenase large terminal subunit
MTASPLTDIAQRLLANVDKESGDLAAEQMRVPARSYLDVAQWEREIEEIYRKVPLVTAFSVDLPQTGSFVTLEIADRPVLVVRGDDGVARSFLNVCRHRGAQVACVGRGRQRRFTCPYHSWVYDTRGALVGVPQRDTVGPVDVDGLVELPTAERSGVVFTVLTPGLHLDIDEWLGDMASALDMLELDRLHPYDVPAVLASGNWKTTADGYLDGYHIGYLHSATIGAKSITNRNTFDLYGPHVRIGFANKPILGMRDLPIEQWNLTEAMSLVHYIFPNISISGQPGRAMMISRMEPGPTVGESTVVQYHYSRTPLTTEGDIAEIEARRVTYGAVTRDEDFVTVIGINRGLPAFGDGSFLFGRNETGNHNLHRWVEKLTS